VAISSPASRWQKCCAIVATKVMLLISEKDIDALALSGRSNFRVENYPLLAAFSVFSCVLWFCSPVLRKLVALPLSLRKFKPQVVLGMGGFTSTAPVLAGRIRGLPPLSMNQMLFREGEPNDGADGASGDARVQGMRAFLSKNAHRSHRHAVRTELVRLDRRVARRKLGLDEDLATLLVMGGSQGASGINQALIKSLRSCKVCLCR